MVNSTPQANLNNSDGKTTERETVSIPESEAIKALAKRITALERILDPLSYEDSRKLFGGTD